MRRTFWLAGILILTASATSACGGGTHHSTDPTTTLLPTTTSTTPSTLPPATTTTVPDPVNIPPTIDVAYVNAVLAQLNHVYGDVSRQDLAAMSLPKTSAAMLRAIFNDPLFTQELSVATNGLLGDLSNVRRPPGDRVTRVVRLLSASPTCIFAQTSTDYSKVLVKEGQPVGAEYYELTPKAPGNDPQHLNPTPWAIQANEAFSTPPPTVPPNPCAG